MKRIPPSPQELSELIKSDFREIVCSVATGSFFTGLSNAFKQDRHAKDNLEMYIKCIELEQEIRTELITNKYLLQKANQPCDTTSVVNKTIENFDNRVATIDGAIPGFNLEVIKTMRAHMLDTNLSP
jgi:hypothetical protein